MHNSQPNLTAARILTNVIKWLNWKGCESEFSHHSQKRYGIFIVMASVCILFEDFSIYIKQHLILIIHFYINISNTIIIKKPVHMPDINKPSLEWLLVTPAYSTISNGNTKFYLHPRCQEKVLGRKIRSGVNGKTPESKTNNF